jgi:Bacterial SH3 domain
MTRTKKALLVAAATIFIALAAPGDARANEVCTVADPSGTPLNVRSQPKPNGSILGALNNDTSVVVKERRGQWASIVPDSAGKSGWVWAEYLSCGKNLPANATEPRVYDCKGETVEVTFFDHHGGEVTVYHISMDIENGRAARYVRNTLVVKPGPRRPLTICFEPDPPQKKGVATSRDPSKLLVLPRLTVNGHRCRQTSHHEGDGE